jgi:hypothetical protein
LEIRHDGLKLHACVQNQEQNPQANDRKREKFQREQKRKSEKKKKFRPSAAIGEDDSSMRQLVNSYQRDF